MLTCIVASVHGWTPPDPKVWAKSPPSPVLSRRDYVAASLAGTVLAGKTLETSAATPVGKDLVKPGSLKDKVIVITGGTTGLGLESGKALAKGGATVVLTARTEQKGAKAVEAVQNFLIEQGIQNNKIYSVQLDLDDLKNVKSFDKRFQEKLGNLKIDVLMNNAGVMAIPERQLTKDGYERTFQSNHLGHFVLTSTLVPILKDNARIINVSSAAYQIAAKGLDFENINSEKEYNPWGSYGQSKLENILFTQELQRRADSAGLKYTVNALHPGAVNTDLARNMMGGEEVWNRRKEVGPTNLFEKVMDATIKKALLKPEDGAATQVYLAAADSEGKGLFYDNLKPEKLPSFATDENKAKVLWEMSEKLGGIKFSFK